ncbi:hypothetical protein IGI04_024781, partial [Brassica rapa subsp. trilocularis]
MKFLVIGVCIICLCTSYIVLCFCITVVLCNFLGYSVLKCTRPKVDLFNTTPKEYIKVKTH